MSHKISTAVLTALALLFIVATLSFNVLASKQTDNEGFIKYGAFHATRNVNGVEHVVKYPREERWNIAKQWFKDRIAQVQQTQLKADRFSVDKHWCPNNSYFDFIPLREANIPANSQQLVQWSAPCFRNTTASLKLDNSGATITITAEDASSLFCSDLYWIIDREHIYEKEVLFHGTHEIKIDKFEDYEYTDLSLRGIETFLLPCGAAGTIESIAKTATLFDSTSQARLFLNNAEFLTYKMNYTMVDFNKEVAIDKSKIRSGDYVAVIRFDGLDPMIAYGIGGHTGHSAMAVWRNGELFVVESTDANPFGPVYWPPPYGIIATPFDTWVQQASKAAYHVAILPLNRTFQLQFNETAAWAWYETVQGMPYGYKNFLASFLDTYPLHNLPAPIDEHGFNVLMSVAGHLLPNNTEKTSIYSMIIEGLNKRFEKFNVGPCYDMTCVNQVLDKLGLDLTTVEVMPEQDSWTYSNNYSMVCSVFAFQMWKAGFGASIPNPIQGTEQTPKDNYQLAIFEPNWVNDENCPGGVQSTPNGSYCQILGQYVLTLPGYNTIPLYAHMNELCPAEWPDYIRCPADQPTCC